MRALASLLLLAMVVAPHRAGAEGEPTDADVQDAPLERTTGKVQAPRSLEEIKKSGYVKILVRNNSTSFFIYRGHRMGFDYELGKRLAQQLGIRAQFVVPHAWAEIIPALEHGEGDVVAGEMTVTPERAARVKFAEPYLTTSENVISRHGKGAVKSPEELAGKTVRVRQSSSYWGTLAALNQKLIAAGKPAIVLEAAPETEETDDLLEQVAQGKLDYTVADALIAKPVAAFLEELEIGPALTEPRPLAWAVRADGAPLAEEINRLFRSEKKLPEFNILKRKYFEADRDIRKRDQETVAGNGSLSPYDPLIRKAAEKYGYDWRLVAAQIYQESRFDPKRKSWCGAQGLFQIMPATARELGVTDPVDVVQGIEGGCKYMARIMKHFADVPDAIERYKLSLAAYNCGPGHVDDARRILRSEQRPAETWEQVRVAMLELSRETVHGSTHYGYCRCGEPVDYVRHITERYDGYRQLVPAETPAR